MTLDELKIGESATVTYVGGSGSLRQHFLDGFNTRFCCDIGKIRPYG